MSFPQISTGRLLTGLMLAIFLFISACRPIEEPVPDTATPTRQIRITLYNTPTPTLIPPSPTLLPALPVTPAPSPTPFTHTIRRGDTLLLIAGRYGVSLADLRAANPEIDPNFLTIGSIVIIPIDGDISTAEPTSTAAPVQLTDPICYLTVDGGAWCLASVENETGVPLENVSTWIGIFNDQGENLSGKTSLLPLNVIWPGERLPAAVYFPPTIPTQITARAEMLANLPYDLENERYLRAEISDLSIEPVGAGKLALVKGRVDLPELAQARQVWVVAVAYDENNRPAGFSKWRAEDRCISGDWNSTSELPLPEACLDFEMEVFSLGPMIDRVEVLVEARSSTP
jgi:LysM repeat protein